ncbi:MAG: sigma-70 family RNA polymerase sigma factor [Deltaproteobacteria bacterium]|nr:sigma-70 family RNA polymerase sigma factor [Deltaproteobacteria bacterium]
MTDEAQRKIRDQEDRELVEAAKDGDNEAFGKLVERYQKRVYALAFGILRNRDDAWDVAQEAFVKAFKNLGTFEGSSAFYTWLYRIAYNLSLDVLRAKNRRETVDFEASPRIERALSEEAQGPADPGSAADRSELQKVIGTAMSQLSDKHRAIIILREVEGLSYTEMADILKISKGTVMSRLFHARKNLQALLTPYLDSGELPEDGSDQPIRLEERTA